jgi:hypothetical protein
VALLNEAIAQDIDTIKTENLYTFNGTRLFTRAGTIKWNKMNKVQLIEGKFSREEAIDLLNALYNVKIRFHEDRIDHQMNEEDIKIRKER